MNRTYVLICKELAGVPEEIQVIPYGIDVQTPKGPFTLDEEAAASVMANFERQENQMVIDYEHQTLYGVQAPAAGWITRLINKSKDGIWAAVEWTDRAKQYLANREYRYVSPVFLKRTPNNKVFCLINVALTNQPSIDGMVPLVNKSGFEYLTEKETGTMWKELLKLLGLAESATENDAIAAVNKLKIMINKPVLAALGLADSATEQEAIAMVNKIKFPVTLVANKAVMTALGLAETATEAEVTGTIMAMKQSHDRVGTLAQELANLRASLGAKDASDLVAQAMKDGKITPAQKEWAETYAKNDLEGFKVFVAKAPVVVIQGKVVTEKVAEGAIDETQLQVNSQMGIDQETFKKYNK